MFVEIWSLSSEADLEHFETSNIELFAKKPGLLTVSYFYKQFHVRCFAGF